MSNLVLVSGLFAGLGFTLLETTKMDNKLGEIAVYQVLDNGPKISVNHYYHQEKISDEERLNDVQITFGRFIPAGVSWKENYGFYQVSSDRKLIWNSQEARFSFEPAPEPEVKENQPKEDNVQESESNPS